MGDPTGRDWETAGRKVCCQGAWWVSKDSARAVPAEPVLRDHRQLLGGCGVMGHKGILAPQGDGLLTISGSYLKDEGWSLQPENEMQEEEEKSFLKFSPLSHRR